MLRFAIAKMSTRKPETIAEAHDSSEEWRLHGFMAQGQLLAGIARAYLLSQGGSRESAREGGERHVPCT